MKLSNFQKHFFMVMCPQIIFALIAIFDIILNGPSGFIIVTLIMWFFMHVMGEGIFLHRYFAHKTFQTHKFIAKTFAILAAIGGFGEPISYRAFHVGLHHAYSDKPGDCHSPVTHGFWYSAIGWHLDDHKLPLMLSKDLMRDPFYVFLQRHLILVWWTAFTILSVIDIRLGIYGMGLAGLIGIIGIACATSVSHSYGSRRFNTDDNSRNIWPLSWIYLQGSAALQNNHHAYPRRYHDSHAWYELDLGKYIIPLIATKITSQEIEPFKGN